MTLALRLGRTLGEVMEGMDTYELSLWREFDRLSPLGDEREDLRNAHLASVVARGAGAKVSGLDMLLRWGEEPQEARALKAGEAKMKKYLLGQAAVSA